jgi:carboxylesterase
MGEDEVMETSPIVVAGAEPFAADGGPLGVLLSHGFTGSPASMTPWGRALAERGHTVRVPRLPGHGTTWQDMNRTRWEDWYAEVDAALDELRERCETVAVAGLSMGGALALRLAELRPDDVDSVVLVNPAIGLRNWQLRLVPALKWVVPAMPGIGNDIKKPGADETGYDKTPLKALASQLKGWRLVAADLEKVTAPLLVFRSTNDHVVDETSLGLIRAGVSSEVAEYVTLHDSYLVATIDNDAELII